MSNFPNIQYQIADKAGNVTPPWRDAFNKLWSLASGENMSASRALIEPVQLGVSPSSLVLGGANGTRVDKVTATNSTASTRTVSAYIVPTGRTADATTQVAFEVDVAANTSLDLTTVGGHVLNKGWTLQLAADLAAAITIAISGAQL